MRIYFQLLELLKCDLGVFKKAMFQVVAWPYELIFYRMVGSKRDLFEVEKAIVHGDDLLCDLIFCVLGRRKCDLDVVEKTMIEESCIIQNLFLPPDRPKCHLSEVEKALFQGNICTAKSFSAFYRAQNATLTRSQEQ